MIYFRTLVQYGYLKALICGYPVCVCSVCNGGFYAVILPIVFGAVSSPLLVIVRRGISNSVCFRKLSFVLNKRLAPSSASCTSELIHFQLNSSRFKEYLIVFLSMQLYFMVHSSLFQTGVS